MSLQCGGCVPSLMDLAPLFQDPVGLWNFLAEHSLVRSKVQCPTCWSEVGVNANMRFKCTRLERVKEGRKTSIRRCSLNLTARRGTFFGETMLPVSKIVQLMYWSCLAPSPIPMVAAQVHVSRTTATSWCSYFRVVAVHHCVKSSEKIGGRYKTVEIDEAKFIKQKDDDVPVLRDQWVLGGFQRGTKKQFLVPLPDRRKETLHDCLREWVLPYTDIVSNSWASFGCLELNDYTHRTVDHFPTPSSGTSNTGGEVQDMLSEAPTTSRRHQHTVGSLAMTYFRMMYPDAPLRFHQFLKATADLYPPQ
ncbi:hypothetical protein GWK47_005837 [Chionoecetes opilio]|uniref:ISXO2-like transposase domain-containing protein n=1 Tax=Chionoecetes opilio TaxID=41210 RepID=A0A8J4Y8W2_CHIOP|nr:hypothetical protein GWK47_005837 [Chionoecetes opilio]